MNITILQFDDAMQAAAQLREIGCDTVGVRLMEQKAVFKTIKIARIRSKAANLLKQTFLGKGGDVALGRGSADLSEEYTDALIMATLKQYQQAIAQLKLQPWGLPKLAERLEIILRCGKEPVRRVYRWCDRTLTVNETDSLVMGILNITPDSFSDGGKYDKVEAAVRHVEEMQEDGADIIDIGAESTRPYAGAKEVAAAVEMERLLPLLEKVLSHCSAPVSVDTYKACVAEEALKCGAHIINDIGGLQRDAMMADVVARYEVPVVVMHNREKISYPRGVMQDIRQFLQKSIEIGIEKGIKSDNIIVDPGIGFAKDFAQNMEVMAKLEELQLLGSPVLLGASRKRFIGEVLHLSPTERLEGTIAVAALGKTKGVQIHRVHDVKAIKRTLMMLDAMMRSGKNDENSNQ